MLAKRDNHMLMKFPRRPRKAVYRFSSFVNERGMSLLETTVVLTIMGIISYTAITRFASSSAQVQAHAAANLLMHDLRFAQQWAVSNSRNTTVAINVQGNRYALLWQDTGAYLIRPTGGGDYVVRFGQGEFPDVELASTELFGGTLTFDANGRPYQGQQPLATSAIVAAFSDNLMIRVTPNTGRIELIE